MGIVAAINLVSRAPAPTSVYIARVTGAHQPWFGWAPPIRARVRGPFDPLGSNGREINLTVALYNTFSEITTHKLFNVVALCFTKEQAKYLDTTKYYRMDNANPSQIANIHK